MRWVVAACTLLLAGVAVADGIVMPPVAETRIPGIPNQQAIVVFKDGVERLIVQSTVDGKGGELAWLVPVPAEPTEIKTAERGLFVAADVIFGPRVEDLEDMKDWMWPVTIIIMVSGIVCGIVLILKGRKAFVVTLAICVVLLCVSLPNLVRTRLGPTVGPFAGVNSTPAQIVGNYRVQTLQADTPEALNQWLGQNGFQGIPKSGEAVVADYIKQGWRFVAAKLRSEADGLLRPHPLSITFPAKAPVYPMRMTQWAGTDLHLDLYVIAGQRMTVKGMDTVYSDRFYAESDGSEIKNSPLNFTRYNNGCVILPYADNEDNGGMPDEKDRPKHWAVVGFPPLTALMWNKCVVVRLSGTFTNQSLDHDVSIIQTTERTYYRQEFYSPRAVRYVAFKWALIVGGVLMLLGPLVVGLRQKQKAGPMGRLKASVPGIFAGLVVYLLVFLFLPVTPVRLTPENGAWGARMYGGDSWRKVMDKENLKGLNKTEIMALVRKQLAGKINPLTNEPFSLEAIPGDMEFLSDEKGMLILRVYELGYSPFLGEPTDIELDIPAM